MIDLPAAEVRISFRDGSGSVGRLVASVGGSTTLATARAAVATLLGPLAVLSGCAIVGYSVIYTTHISSVKGDPGRRAAERGIFVFTTDTTDAYLVVSVPGINAELVAADNTIDPAQPGVAGLAAAIVGGPWCNPFGADAVALEASYQEFNPV